MEQLPANETVQTENENNNDTLTAGIILIVLGVLFLIGQVIDLGSLFWTLLPGLGMLIYGIIRHEVGWMIPGGILSGVGLGIIAMESTLVTELVGANDEGGIFLVAFSLGWASITLASLFFADEPQWWPLIPGGIIGLVGMAVISGGVWMTALEALGNLWPIFLILAGVGVLIGALRSNSQPQG